MVYSMIIKSSSIFFLLRKITGRKEGNVLFNDALTFYLRLYGVGHMVKDQSDSERLTARFFLYAHPTDRITHTTACVTPVVEHWPMTGLLGLRTRASYSQAVSGEVGDPQISRAGRTNLCRSRIGHTRLTQSYIMKRYPLP